MERRIKIRLLKSSAQRKNPAMANPLLRNGHILPP
jgi:hypothetical protein